MKMRTCYALQRAGQNQLLLVKVRLTHGFGLFSLGIEDRKLKLGAHLTFWAAD